MFSSSHKRNVDHSGRMACVQDACFTLSASHKCHDNTSNSGLTARPEMLQWWILGVRRPRGGSHTQATAVRELKRVFFESFNASSMLSRLWIDNLKKCRRSKFDHGSGCRGMYQADDKLYLGSAAEVNRKMRMKSQLNPCSS